MKAHRVLCLSLAGLVSGILGMTARAEPSCTKWMPQADGSSFRTCVGDDGKQYCESSRNGTVSRVSCSG